jgi:hypothetical protein
VKKYGRKITIIGQRWETNNNQKTQMVYYRYEEKIAALLDFLQTTQTGTMLLSEIETPAKGGKVKIMPPPSGRRVSCYAGVPSFKKEAEVQYHPNQFGSACPGVGTTPEEVLYHELFHAGQIVHGVYDRSPVPKEPGMTDFMEFCAVTASNMLRSELGRPDLRKNHASRDAAKDLIDPEHYYNFFLEEIEKWFRLQPALCGHMAQMKMTFNPLRSRQEAHRARGYKPVIGVGQKP